MKTLASAALIFAIASESAPSQDLGDAAADAQPIVQLEFDGNTDNATRTSVNSTLSGTASFVPGLEGQALSLTTADSPAVLTFDRNDLPFGHDEDFSVQFWVRTTANSDRRMVLLSQKEFADNSLASQKQQGWVFYVSGGTWAWNMGSGERRISYERDNGKHMPINDGRWHQLTMTFDSALSQVRLFYDGQNRVVYNVGDSEGFDFTNPSPLVVGWNGTEASPAMDVVPSIYTGAQQLQNLVDEFNSFGLKEVQPDEFVHLIVDPQRLFRRKGDAVAALLGDSEPFLEGMRAADFERVSRIEADLMRNPYTIHQAVSFIEAAPAMKIYSLVDGKVTVQESAARAFTERERLYPTDLDMDKLAIFDRVLSTDEVLGSYSKHFKPPAPELEDQVTSITAASWNIFHGGKHFWIDEHGWDSRVAIAEILKRENVDVVMMQETYSSGDFIAAELGYYFATTVDRDYLNQGANISVLSRYPIEELYVEGDSTFMNVGTKIAVSKAQDLYAMSNWYGMEQFPAVFDFHASRFQESDTIPTVFAGDFNAVPHTDGGDSPASRALLGAGFTDAFRSLYPNAEEHPGPSHRSGRRIDQLYYKGTGLRNTSTRVVTTWPTGFPSDHYLILATFDLDYSSGQR